MKENDSKKIRSEEIRAENLGETTLFQRRENLQKHASYARERMQHDAIRNGQVEQIRSLLHQKPDGIQGTLSKNQLRNSKNMFIAGITLFTRAAIDGGVPEETAYSLSDGYIQTVEDCVDSASIENLSRKAAERFAQEVKKYGTPHYSRTIDRAVQYIHLHLHTAISLEGVSEAAGISPCYLSRLFRKETGMSIVDYIQKERIEAACNMLSYSEYTVSQIGEYLCFANQSYFIRIFKKFMGITPAKYRKYAIHGTEWTEKNDRI